MQYTVVMRDGTDFEWLIVSLITIQNELSDK